MHSLRKGFDRSLSGGFFFFFLYTSCSLVTLSSNMHSRVLNSTQPKLSAHTRNLVSRINQFVSIDLEEGSKSEIPSTSASLDSAQSRNLVQEKW